MRGVGVGVMDCAMYKGMRNDAKCATDAEGRCCIEPNKHNLFEQFCK
jgi:hypothetical protein